MCYLNCADYRATLMEQPVCFCVKTLNTILDFFSGTSYLYWNQSSSYFFFRKSEVQARKGNIIYMSTSLQVVFKRRLINRTQERKNCLPEMPRLMVEVRTWKSFIVCGSKILTVEPLPLGFLCLMVLFYLLHEYYPTDRADYLHVWQSSTGSSSKTLVVKILITKALIVQ